MSGRGAEPAASQPKHAPALLPAGRVFVPPQGEPFELVDAEAEVSLLGKSSPHDGPVQARGVSGRGRPAVGAVWHLPGTIWRALHALCVPPSSITCLQVDARALARELLRLHFGAVLAVGQACVLGAADGRRLLLRVTSANVLDEGAREEALGYHCFRGKLCSCLARRGRCWQGLA